MVVATPGRLEDLIRQGACSLGSVMTVVLDEADHMADIGFLPAVVRILDQIPGTAQRLLFSATLDHEIDSIVRRYLTNPVRHEYLLTDLGRSLRPVIVALAGGSRSVVKASDPPARPRWIASRSPGSKTGGRPSWRAAIRSASRSATVMRCPSLARPTAVTSPT